MTAFVSQLLEQAPELIERNPGSSAAKRRAVGTAYYATFHAIMQLCADAILPNSDIASAEFGRVYRRIDHGPLKLVSRLGTLADQDRRTLALHLLFPPRKK